MAKNDNGSAKVGAMLKQFVTACHPLETSDKLTLLTDERTGAQYCECHLLAKNIIELGTTDVPLDPEEQSEYRANRDIEETSVAFQKMKDDAKLKRSFSNIVCEWQRDPEEEIVDLLNPPLKIIGGQHRFEAIRYALDADVDVYHGIKVYFDLDMQQRLDVQLISNTNIDISGDLIDRLRETAKGPSLRDWCQSAGLLKHGQDFADSYARGGPISVRMATTFITNYFNGKGAGDAKNFGNVSPRTVVYKSGGSDELWEEVKAGNPKLWHDAGLMEAAKEFAELIAAQREWFKNGKKSGRKSKPDYPEKALNFAVMAAWAYVAGLLHNNQPRLKRHFALKKSTAHDPLNAAQLATGKHWTDPTNYRGLGYRTDPQEQGRFVELFFLQAEDGKGITKSSIDIAIKQHHAKQGQFELAEAKAKAEGN